LCDDILITADGVERGCPHGQTALLAARASADAIHPEAWEAGSPVSRVQALDRAAAVLAGARRVLVTGLANATLESITAAFDLADTLGAAVDAGLPETARTAGPTIARAGEVTAVWEELRDRADLVIFWCCDPTDSHPRFIERFVAPTLADGRQRRTIAVGPAGVMPDASTHSHLPLARELTVEAARWLQMRIAGRHVTLTDTPLSAACVAVEAALQTAACVAIITADADDPVGLEAWSVVHLVRTIAHEKPAFQIPLGSGIAASGANVAGAAAACTWTYGAAGAIARADRMGGLFLPAESDARRLIDRGEIDAVLILGRLNGPLEQAIIDRGGALAQVRISDAMETASGPAVRTISLRCVNGSFATAGTMLREDGRRVVLAQHRQGRVPPMRELLVDLAGAVRQSLAMPDAGGRP
jgi:formylmethanofuran dehydrogenase subunit B